MIRAAIVLLMLVQAISVSAVEKVTARQNVLQALAIHNYQFTLPLRRFYLKYERLRAVASLKKRGVVLPQEFLHWLDADRSMAVGVYAAHHKPADVLLWLYSLRFDLGQARFEKYRQLALAAALVSAKEGMTPNIQPRKPLKLVIPGDPREPVNTRDPNRKLDKNDHIINFLNEHTIEEDVPVNAKGAPVLKYNKQGVAILQRGKKVGPTKKRKRTLFASDVLASRKLQAQFNAYMKSKGFPDVKVDCGDRVIHWNSRKMVRGEPYRKINSAYLLFRRAYEAKGRLPKKRDPFPSPAERCAYLIRNFEYQFPQDLQAKRKWPRFPLTAPWPLLTMLVADRQPLREREERWIAFRDRGEFYRYGEYIYGIAQQHAMQSARRLRPYPFTYAAVQMMLKDGGVCGTMASISARGHVTLGIPATQATQPGHCAMVAFRYDKKNKTFRCQGGQYATGGDDKTGPFTPWPFERAFRRTGRRNGYEISFHDRKPMVYHQSLAWGVNYGFATYLDGVIAYRVFQMLPKDRNKEKLRLLSTSIAANPYNLLVIDAGQSTAATSKQAFDFWRVFDSTLRGAAGRPGCPTTGLFTNMVKARTLAKIASLAVPQNRQTAAQILDFLVEEKFKNARVLAAYRKAVKP